MNYYSQSFRKSERLCSKKAIAELFEYGNSLFSFPFQIIWMRTDRECPCPAQVAISVSKKTFKKAVERNLIKRRMREAWRRNKNILYEFLESKNIRIVFIIIFKDNSIPLYSDVEKSIRDSAVRLIKDILVKATVC